MWEKKTKDTKGEMERKEKKKEENERDAKQPLA